MSVRSRSDKEAVLEYRGGGDWPGYPFGLSVTARYELLPGRFRLTLTAGNHGNGPLPVSLGWHPYFTLPGVPRVDLLRLRLPAERYVRVDEKLIPTGELPPVEGTPWDFTTPRAIGSGELDLGFPLKGEKIVLSTPGERSLGGNVRTLAIEVSGAFRYCQLFVPPERSSVAVEPLTAATDAFNNPELGLAVLEPGTELRGSCQVSLT
jgi:aldose 1-epimerase